MVVLSPGRGCSHFRLALELGFGVGLRDGRGGRSGAKLGKALKRLLSSIITSAHSWAERNRVEAAQRLRSPCPALLLLLPTPEWRKAVLRMRKDNEAFTQSHHHFCLSMDGEKQRRGCAKTSKPWGCNACS